MKLSHLYIYISILLPIVSCGPGQLSVHHFDENSWNFRDSIGFSFHVVDTIKPHHVSIFFRNTLEYPYQNLFLIMESMHNNKTVQKDTLEYLITNKYGQWLGNGLGKIKNNHFIVDENMIFEQAGEYVFVIHHGMRENPLRGVNAVGLKIE
tara:strand:+ start:612 stop:1064 length:453 start_codon:yes stop_codon:yes gene_type:complete